MPTWRRLSDHKRALKRWDIEVVNTKKGSHPWKAIGTSLATGRVHKFGFVAHNGLRSEIDDAYVEPLCDQFGIPEAEYRAELG